MNNYVFICTCLFLAIRLVEHVIIFYAHLKLPKDRLDQYRKFYEVYKPRQGLPWKLGKSGKN